MAKTVRIEGKFEVIGADSTIEGKKVIRDTTTVEEASQHFPQKVAGNSVNEPINMGGVTLAKRIYLEVDQEVTLKLSEITDTGFLFGPGVGIFSSFSGITGIWLSTGANETVVEAIITGD
jgi:hypothetical protein